MLRRGSPLLALLAGFGGFWAPASAGTGVGERTLLVDGTVSQGAIGAQASIARGLAELLLSRHVGLRIEGFTQLGDAAADSLRARLTSASFGVTIHPLPDHRIDPYLFASAGGTFIRGEGALLVAPELSSAGGVNVHFGAFFLHAQASWHFGNWLLPRAPALASDVRVTAGLGFAFDLGQRN
jgi:hypothetical protein